MMTRSLTLQRLRPFVVGFIGVSIFVLYCLTREDATTNEIRNSDEKISAESTPKAEDVICKIEPFNSFGQISNYLEDSRNELCGKLKTAGGNKLFGFLQTDGHKWLCPMHPWLNSSNCTVYSFGINKDWTFDDEMARYYGCKVYSFDPTIGLEDHQRSPLVSFYNLGISNITGLQKLGKKEGCKVSRMSDIRAMLNHKNQRVDVLKMDVEGSELGAFEDIWNTSPDFLSKHVGQIAMEIHLGMNITSYTPRWRKYWIMIQRLECLGFRLAHWEPNLGTQLYYTHDHYRYRCCYELLWLNKNMLLKN